jgi:hypothetical protein
MKEVDGNSVGFYDGIAYIIYENVGTTISKVAKGNKFDDFISLNDLLKMVGYDGLGVCTVIIETPTEGRVYRYGNYMDGKWYTHGYTYGYA